MANTFTRYTAKNVGTTPITLVTANAATQTTVIGMTIANTITSPITASAYITDAAVTLAGTGGVSSTTLTVATVVSGTIYNGATVTGTGVSGTVTIVGQLTSTAAAVTSTTFGSGGAVGENAVILASVSSVVQGQLITGTGLAAGTVVTSVNSITNTVTTSNNFTVQASGTYSFYAPGGVGTYTMSSAQTITTGTVINIGASYYIVSGATIPVGGSLALFGADGKLVLNTGDSFVVVSGTAASADVIVSALQIT